MRSKDVNFILDTVGVFTVYEMALELGKSVEEVREVLRGRHEVSRPRRSYKRRGEGKLLEHLQDMFKTAEPADDTGLLPENRPVPDPILEAREKMKATAPTVKEILKVSKERNNKELEAMKLRADHPWIENPQKFLNYMKELKSGTD